MMQAPRSQATRTAFVFAGGGSLGAVQVGMLKALARIKVVPDFVVGASVGAINGAYFAADPGEDGIARLERIWGRLHRTDVFPFSFSNSLLAILGAGITWSLPRIWNHCCNPSFPARRWKLPAFTVTS